MKLNELRPDEARIIIAYRAADERAQADALDLLNRHPVATPTGSGETMPAKVIDIDRITRR